MTQPPGFEEELEMLERLAPLRDLNFTDDNRAGPFGLQAVLGFVRDQPLLQVVVRAYSEVPGLSRAHIDALEIRARDLRAGFALYISAGEPTEAEPDEPESPDPNDPLALIIEPVMVHPDDPSLRRFLEDADLLTIIDPKLKKGESDVYKYRRRRWARIRVRAGRARLKATGYGSQAVSAGGLTGWLCSRKMTVKGLAKGTKYTYYSCRCT